MRVMTTVGKEGFYTVIEYKLFQGQKVIKECVLIDLLKRH